MESITTCEVCYVNYDTKDHAPRVLPCGHTMCTECLTNILNNQTLRKCSFDNIAFASNQNSATSFPLNFIVINMLEQKKNGACKTHPDERLKFICLTDRIKICTECAKHEDHKDHSIKKIKTLKAEGVKVKRELQQSLSEIKGEELEKEKDCEQTRKVFIRTITEQFKEIKEILVEKEFEFVQQANSLFDANKINYSEGTFAWKQQIDETIKDITHACQDENGDMMILDKEVRENDQNITKKRIQFLREKSSRVHNRILEVQNSIKEALVHSKTSVNSLELSTQELVGEIYSVQEESEQLSQEELGRRHEKLKHVKFTSYFDIQLEENGKVLKIIANSLQPKEAEINLNDFRAIERIDVRISRYDTLRKDPIPNVLSYIFHGLKNVQELIATFDPLNFSHDSFLWLGEIIRNHIQHLKRITLRIFRCKFNDESMSILCNTIFSQEIISLQSFVLNLNGCQLTDGGLKLLAESLKPFHQNLNNFGIGLNNNIVTSRGFDDMFKLIQSMPALKTLQLSLQGLKLYDETIKMFGESLLPSLQYLDSLYLWLAGCSISDECIAWILKSLPNLKVLNIDLSGTALTDQTLEMFIETVLPRLEILKSFSFKLEGTRVKKTNLDKIQKISEDFKENE